MSRKYYIKKTVITLFLLMAAAKINAETLLDISWNLGSGGFGVNYSPENNGSIELSISVFNLIIEEQYTNIGFEFNPLKCWYLFELQDEFEPKHDGIKYSFINTKLYWNILDNDNFILGPFAAVNYMFISSLNGFNKDEYIFSLGLDFSYRYRIGYYSLQVGVEAGYRNITGTNNFYFVIKGDIIPALIGFGMGMGIVQSRK